MFEDDFESYSAGQFPGAPWKVRINHNPSSTDTTLVNIATAANSGSKAVRVISNGQFAPTFVFLNFAAATKQADHLYVRMYINASMGLGGNGGHAHIIELSKDGQNGIRYGEANGSIGINVAEGSDALSPQQGQANEDLAPNTWHCLEVLFDKRPEYDEATTWVDGRIVHEVNNRQSQWRNIWTNNGPAPGWLATAFNDQINFGWYAFSGVRANNILFDDVVISTEPVGCNYMPSGTRNTGFN